MTANQIANAANVETNRHNLAQEALAEESNAISRDRNRIQEDYNNRITDIQDRYNKASIELQTAQGQRKLDLQEQLNWIEFEKYNADANYKAEMTRINEMNANTNARNQVETERYQKKLNELGFTDQEIRAQLASLQEKQLEYQKYNMDQNIRIQDFNALINKQKVDNEYSLGLLRTEVDTVRNELMQELQAYQEATMTTHSIWEGVKTIGGLITGRR